MKTTRGHRTMWAGLGMALVACVFGGAVGLDATAGAQSNTSPLQVNVMAVVPKQAHARSQISVPITAVGAESMPVSVPVAVLFGGPDQVLTCVAYGLTDSVGRYDARFKIPA